MSNARSSRRVPALPEPPTGFVGRVRELAQIGALLAAGRRLVTLVGPGGIGKTRLALRAAAELETSLGEAVFVDLVAMTDPQLIDEAILEATAIGPHAGRAPLPAVVEFFTGRLGLLVVDSCEHLSGEVARVVQELTSRCPGLQVLVTSREALGLPGETIWAVPPMALDPLEGVDGPSEAAQLFIARTLFENGEVSPTSAESASIEYIVRELDGIPLAIELVAAYARTMTLAGVRGSVGRWRLSAHDPTRGERHRTMRRSLDWSHAFLSAPEALLFRRLSVFAGGWTLDAAEQICADPDLSTELILDSLTALVDKSLVLVHHADSATRFHLLGAVREYAAELVPADEAKDLAVRHRRHYVALAEHADACLWALSSTHRARLDIESPNLRAALDEACRSRSSDALRMVAALGFYWRVRGRFTQGVQDVALALAVTANTASASRAMALATHATLVFWTGDLSTTKETARRAIAVAETVGDRRSHAHALARHATAVMMAHPRRAQSALRHAATLAREVQDPVALCDALGGLAMSCHWQDDFPRMMEAILRSDEVAASIGFDSVRFWNAWARAHRARLTDGPEAARVVAAEMAALVDDDDALMRGTAAELIAILDIVTGSPARGFAVAEAEVVRSRREAVRWGSGMVQHAMGLAKVATGDFAAARLLGEQLYARERDGAGYLAWHAGEILMLADLIAGDPQGGRLQAERIIAIADHLGNPRAETVARAGLARAALLDGDLVEADAHAQEALAACARQGWWVDALSIVEVIAAVALERGQPDRAIRLFAGVRAARVERGLVRFQSDNAFWDAHVEAARTALGPMAADRADIAGSPRSLEQTVEYAGRGRGSRKRRGRGWTGLTRMERQVADLAARGLSNAAIAAELFIAHGTVKNHLAHVFGKLEITNRTELAARMDHLHRSAE